jgi:hypothetical protein
MGTPNHQLTMQSVKWLMGAKLEDLEDMLVIWTEQENAKNGTASGKVITNQAKVLGQQMSVTNLGHNNW